VGAGSSPSTGWWAFAAGGASFGRLGVGDIDKRAAEIEKVAAQYAADGRTPLPMFELIAVVANRSPTESGLYRTREPGDVVDAFLEARNPSLEGSGSPMISIARTGWSPTCTSTW
jgi:hypothetical protein